MIYYRSDQISMYTRISGLAIITLYPLMKILNMSSMEHGVNGSRRLTKVCYINCYCYIH